VCCGEAAQLTVKARFVCPAKTGTTTNTFNSNRRPPYSLNSCRPTASPSAASPPKTTPPRSRRKEQSAAFLQGATFSRPAKYRGNTYHTMPFYLANLPSLSDPHVSNFSQYLPASPCQSTFRSFSQSRLLFLIDMSALCPRSLSRVHTPTESSPPYPGKVVAFFLSIDMSDVVPFLHLFNH
jgi:hypothetical protein